MENEKKSLANWVNDHKAQLALAGAGAATAILIIVGIRNPRIARSVREGIKGLIQPSEIDPKPVMRNPAGMVEPIRTEPISMEKIKIKLAPHDRAKHIRNLSEGWHPSQIKIDTAKANGFDLKPGQTWVAACRVKGEVA